MDSLRISDAERESAVGQLGEHYALGRLTREEFDERSDAVWTARTRGDLTTIFADLPARPPSPASSPSSSGRRTRRLPMVPIIAILVGLAVLLHAPFVLLLLVAFLWFGPRGCAPRRR